MILDWFFWLRTGWQPARFWKGLVPAQHWFLQSEKMLLFRVSSTSKIPFFWACNQVKPLNSSEALRGGNCHIHYSLEAPRGPEQGSWHLAGLAARGWIHVACSNGAQIMQILLLTTWAEAVIFYSIFWYCVIDDCLAFQEGFSIKWRQVLRTCLNVLLKWVLKMLPKLTKIRVPMWRKVFNFLLEIWRIFLSLKGIKRIYKTKMGSQNFENHG